MEQKRITEEAIQAFRQYLTRDEKSAVTVEKYLRDIRAFQAFIGETPVEKELVIHYKNHLLEESYAVRSINSMLASVNSFLIFMDWPDCKVKSLKVQRQVYCAGVKPGKVFPYNLRKLFARTFYGIEKDIAKLADILGHSSVDTTRIYIMASGTEHRQKLERLGLVV